MFEIKILSNGEIRKYNFQEPVKLSELLDKQDLYLAKPCGGVGKCGKCKVSATGELSPLSDAEKKLLTAEEISSTVRLACETFALGDCTVEFNSDRQINVISSEKMDTSIFSSDNNTAGFCAAVDIGTTTVAAYLVKLPECKIIKSACALNPQTQFGADVISRITYSTSGGLSKLQEVINDCVNSLVNSFGEKIDRTVITGNTVMLHLLCGLDPEKIAVYPFTPQSLFGEERNGAYLPRCISSYVGADITCAVLASKMTETDGSFLVDIGTNGEMAIFKDNTLICASTAAGPAFEGAGISMGCTAKEGAINTVKYENQTISYTTIGNAKPIGICGSGLIDAIASMKRAGVIDETGYLEEPFEIGDSGISISPADIRQIQLAKSAVRAGIDALLYESGTSIDDIKDFCIAGGFGSYLDLESCAEIGLLPREALPKARVIGNGAGSGAIMIACNPSLEAISEDIAANAKTIELSESAVFMEKYIDNMMF